jgi:hypothetical protein
LGKPTEDDGWKTTALVAVVLAVSVAVALFLMGPP